MSYQAIRVRVQDTICFIQLHRPAANNTIDGCLIAECNRALDACGDDISVVVLEGLPEVFCFGADFGELAHAQENRGGAPDPAPLYALWLRLATGPFVSIAHVRGKANAGGIGFVAACDIVLAEESARFSLSELLFGLFPACVLPFLARRVGLQKAHYLTLMTQPIGAQQAQAWGLVDQCDADSGVLLRKHLLRLRRLSKPAIGRYKRFMATMSAELTRCEPAALAANREIFSDPDNLQGILRYVRTGVFPWEQTGEGRP